MKRMVKILVLILSFVFFLSSCVSRKREKSLDINSYIQPPKTASQALAGVWKLTQVKDLKEGQTDLPRFQIGDQLYIDSRLVAIGDYATLHPNFSSKYVSLSAYLSSHLLAPGKLPSNQEKVSIYMVRDKDLFSVDLIAEDRDHIMFIYETRLYSLERESDQVPDEMIKRYQDFAKTEDQEEVVEKKEKPTSTLIGVREQRMGEDGYPINDYSTYLLYEDPRNTRVYVYKLNRLFFPGPDNGYKILDYVPKEIDAETGIREGQFIYYDAEDFEKKRTIVMKDKEAREITFLSPEFISFRMTVFTADREVPKKFEIQRMSQINEKKALNIQELVKESPEQSVQSQVQERLNILDPQGKFDPRSAPEDLTNIGIVRQATEWTFITSRYWKSGDQYLPAYIPLSLVSKVEFFNNSKEPYSWSRIKNKYSQAETAGQSPNGDRLIIKTDNEIHYTKLTGEEIAEKAYLSIQLKPGSDIIMMAYFYDEKAQQLEKAFLRQSLAQPQVIYPH